MKFGIIVRRKGIRFVIAHTVASYLLFPLSWYALPLVKHVALSNELFSGLTKLAYAIAPIAVMIILPAYSLQKYRTEPRVFDQFFDWGCWFCYLVPLIITWLALRPLAIRSQRRTEGLCVACGYDLRASKDRCPECGNPISSP